MSSDPPTTGTVSYKRHRFPAEIISHCVWLYHRFGLSLRDIEDVLAEWGVTLTCETVRLWCRTFGPLFAVGLKRPRSRPGDKWHLDEVELTRFRGQGRLGDEESPEEVHDPMEQQTQTKAQAPYPPTFRYEAVELARTSGKSLAQVARDLGIHAETLRLWVRQAEIDGGRRDGLTTSEREELTQLRRENRLLQEERELLKQAAAFFAKERATR